MTPERYQQIDHVFQSALALEPEKRRSYLDEACSGDDALRSEVESLITSDEGGLSFIDEPAFEMAARVLACDESALVGGDRIDRYEVVSLLGSGGMGEVYLAHDEKLDRKIALKLLPAHFSTNEERLRRFQQEARAASALNHPNIITIHEIGQVDERHYIATEFVDGETLRQRMKRVRLSLAETIDIATQVASALAAAHKAGIVHRDIKPENIMLRHDGYVKVLDFGLAKLTEQRDESTGVDAADNVDISSGLVMGTVKYMSPEQARGQQVDSRSDIFSLGVVLYEMMTGRVPFKGESASELIKSILKDPPPPLTEYLPGAPEDLQRIVDKTLTKDKSRRYQTVEEMLVALRTFRQRDGVGTVFPTMVPHTDRHELSTETLERRTTSNIEYLVGGIKQHRISAGLILTVLAVVVVGVTFSLNRFRSKLRASTMGMKITRIPNTDKAQGAGISPDGKYIAQRFFSGTSHNIELVEIATGNTTRLATLPKDAQPGRLRFSNDGNGLYYLIGGGLYRIPLAAGYEPVKVFEDAGCSRLNLSPDETRVACVRMGSSEHVLSVIALDGSNERVLARRSKPEFLDSTAWSPDGSHIACSFGKQTSSTDRTESLFTVDVATGIDKQLTDLRWLAFERLAWLPDGSGIVATAQTSEADTTQVWEISYPAGEVRRITNDLENYGNITVTADSRTLAVVDSTIRSSIWLAPASDLTAAQPITAGEHYVYRHVAWTPEGKVLFAANVRGSRDVWIMNADGYAAKQLTINLGVNLQPQSCANGRYIVFSSNRANEEIFDIWRMNMDGTNPVQLTDSQNAGQPVCTPDGQWVVYSKGGPTTTPEQKTLWKVSIDGGKSLQISDHPSGGAGVSPDGKMVACWYKSDAPTPMKLALLPIDGGTPIRIFDVIRSVIHPIRWSADGQTLYYIKVEPYIGNIWAQPVSGDPPRPVTKFKSELIEGFDWSDDGRLICSRLHGVQNVTLISDFR